MSTIASKTAAPSTHRAGRILAISALAASLIGAGSSPVLADGYYVAGPTAMPAWSGSTSRTPLAAAMHQQPFLMPGGDDQYVSTSPVWKSWPQAETRTPLSSGNAGLMNFDLAGQGN